ncbi:ribonuclease E/ribonuclease G [Azospirillum fermentarium]|uniref:ribonuclease E/G n=1 Tax=Azospirillum fermentarium TaxID=1233114 RepID=UPI002226FCB7|nr:ribonuclease E/G [Azospirillum fermentarium]MCW2245894.1 ribonuclease E/ribonuclease G [Azospirillum fermentarium]
MSGSPPASPPAPINILADRRGALVRVAVLTGGRLSDLYLDRVDRPALAGAVVAGRVDRIQAGLNAAFVDLGGGAMGMLPAQDVRGVVSDGPPRIGRLLRAGQTVLVQVKAEGAGDKAAPLTMDVSLPGRFLIHVPHSGGLSVSKRLGDAREALARRAGTLIGAAGWIVRASALTADDADLVHEAQALAALWRRMGEGGAAPAVRLPPSGALIRALVEHGAGPVRRIAVEDHGLFAAAHAWAESFAPALAGAVERAPPGLFETADLDSELAVLAGRRVPLPGGACLVIDRTEALTVIDVNAGERGNPMDVNRDAAAEVARQLRLRNIGGIVIVDFLNMRAKGEGERLLRTLSQAVAGDPVQTQVYGVSKLGLVEMTRARRGVTLADALAGTDPLDGLPAEEHGP